MRSTFRRWVRAACLLVPLGVAAEPAEDDRAPAPPAATSPESAAPAAAPELEEEIVVTGSRVRRKDLTTPAPVTVISREALTAEGARTLGELLQLLPEQGNALSRQLNNGGDGSTRVSLRSLGDHRTLVLLNGRRYVAAGVGADRSVDLNTLPAAAVERVEILKDGASPIYGSDAMGGVVNVITRKRWSGVEAAAQGGVTSRGDAATYGASLTVGTASEGGSFLLAGGYDELGSAMAGDRAFTARPYGFDFASGAISMSGSFAGPQGTIALAPFEAGVPDGNAHWNQLVTAYPTARRFVRDPSAPLGWRPFDASALAGEGGDLYNFQPENYLVTPLRLASLFAIGDRRLGGASRVFLEASYVHRRSDQMLAPLPLFTAGEGIVVSADNVYNPFGRDLFNVQRRLVEVDRRRFAQEVDTFRVVGGIEGTFPDGLGSLAGWTWDASGNYGRTLASQTIDGFLTLRGLGAALGPSFLDPGPNGLVETPPHAPLQGDDVAVCGTPASPVAGCVPLDLFNGPGAITPQMVRELTYSGKARGENELLALQANASGPILRLASDRPVGLATGYEYRRVFGELVPDAMTMSGDRRDVRTLPTRGTADVHEVYAELSIPVVSGAPLADDVELLAAARAFKHGRFDPDWTWKLGGRWRPVRDVTLRGTASTAYRVPSIQELFQGETLGDFNFVSDPCADLTLDPVANPAMTPERAAACRAAGVPDGGTLDPGFVPAPVVGNPDLRPETARVLTAGVVLEPRFAPRLSVTVDYWDVRVERVIGQVFPSMIFDLCYPAAAGMQPRLCELVERDPATGRLTKVTARILNGEEERAAGVDLAVRYQLPTRAGRLGATAVATWLRRHDLEQLDGKVLHGKGTYDLFYTPTALTGLNPEWKYDLGVTWSVGALATGANVRFVSGFEECGGGDPFTQQTSPDACSFSALGLPIAYSRHVSSWSALDAFAEYALATRAGRTTLGIGVRNALDEPPPFMASSFTPGVDPSGYDLLGRFFYTRVSHRF